MNLDTMKPGRDLDALIAEKVMGWKPPTEPGISQQEYETRRTAIHPPYSAEIGSAWEVVEKLKNSGRHIIAGPSKKGGYIAYLDFPQNPDWHVNGETTSHAICLAALKAVGA